MKPKFEPDVGCDARVPPSARLIDPEAYDASEPRFAANVEEKPAPPRFVADAVREPSSNLRAGAGLSRAEGGGNEHLRGPEPLPVTSVLPEGNSLAAGMGLETVALNASLQTELLGPPDSDSWRREVADRVNNYRARRRPRAPRYPSLQLKFDPPGTSWTVQAAASQPETAARGEVAMQGAPVVSREEAHSAAPRADDARDGLLLVETTAKILEFPRSFEVPSPALDELAEPIVAQPRILEVPEPLLPPPALGGILMEPVEESAKERRPGFELPLQAAPMSMRVLAGAIDGLLVITAFAVFAYIFFRVTATLPSLEQAAGISVSLMVLFGIAYQYLLLVYTGTTPGLKLAGLQLSRFDGAAVPRKIRRWRVLASLLSGLSLALGYGWCFLDEDRLCWHDRITRTYMAPRSAKFERPPNS